MIKTYLRATALKQRMLDDRGAGLAEYALLLFVVAVAAAGVITTFGDDIIAAFNGATDALPVDGGAPTTATP